jgi:predicted nucleic acid-binding protein
LILVDTSVWVDHFTSNNERLADCLEAGAVVTHPFVIGEIALGSIRDRALVLGSLEQMERSTVASDREVARFIEDYRLYGRGIGYVDVHLLASVFLTPEVEIWTLDRRLRSVAEELGIGFLAD